MGMDEWERDLQRHRNAQQDAKEDAETNTASRQREIDLIASASENSYTGNNDSIHYESLDNAIHWRNVCKEQLELLFRHHAISTEVWRKWNALVSDVVWEKWPQAGTHIRELLREIAGFQTRQDVKGINVNGVKQNVLRALEDLYRALEVLTFTT